MCSEGRMLEVRSVLMIYVCGTGTGVLLKDKKQQRGI